MIQMYCQKHHEPMMHFEKAAQACLPVPIKD